MAGDENTMIFIDFIGFVGIGTHYERSGGGTDVRPQGKPGPKKALPGRGLARRLGLAFTGLAAGTKYLGSVAYGGAAGMPNPTIVRVDVP